MKKAILWPDMAPEWFYAAALVPLMTGYARGRGRRLCRRTRAEGLGCGSGGIGVFPFRVCILRLGSRFTDRHFGL